MTRTPRQGTILVRALLLLGAIFTLAACSAGSKNQKMVQAPVPVTVGTVVRKSVPIQVSSIGHAEALATVTVKPQIGGELTAVFFKPGQEVKKGDSLFEIDPRPFKTALGKSEALLAKDTALAAQAASDEQIDLSLLKKSLLSQEQYDTAHTSTLSLQNQVKADEAQVESDRLTLTYSAIDSPIGGRTGDVLLDVGNIVTANASSLVTINTISPMYVTFTLPEQYLAEVRAASNASGLEVEAVASDGEKNPAKGKLAFIDNSVDASSGTFRLKGLFENRDDRLWPGQFLKVELTLGAQRDVLIVPTQAVQSGQNGNYLFVVGLDKKVESRPVSVSRVVGDEAVIASGLRAGETVVTDGQLLLMPGALVEIKGTAAPAPGKSK